MLGCGPCQQLGWGGPLGFRLRDWPLEIVESLRLSPVRSIATHHQGQGDPGELRFHCRAGLWKPIHRTASET